ncbi:MAG: hypothetical protein P9L92_18775 [Candidatus Electryonea clarkiae]|nr:hypothetical protein [Candidatus Electryonea clarkiae]
MARSIPERNASAIWVNPASRLARRRPSPIPLLALLFISISNLG